MTTQQIASTRLRTVDMVGGLLARYGLVIVIAWYGGLKFMNYEAQGIQPLVSASPFMGWLYDIFSVYTCSALLGVFELTAAALLTVKPWWPRVSPVGRLLAIVLFLATLGGFLMKDIALLGISVWTLTDALRAVRIGYPEVWPSTHSTRPQ